MPHAIELQRRLKDQGLVLIGVHTKGSGEKMASYAAKTKIDFPIAIDTQGKTVAAYKVDSYPDFYLIDKFGKLRVADLANGDLERAVKVLLAEKGPEPKKVKAGKKAKPSSRPSGKPEKRATKR